MVLMLSVSVLMNGQSGQSPEQIRQRMAEIRRTTNWDDPAAAAKANAEIKKLATQLGGSQPPVSFGSSQAKKEESSKPVTISVKSSEISKENVIAIAERYFNRSYKALDAVSKAQFDLDLKTANEGGFKLDEVRTLTTTGGLKLTFGTDHDIACVYLASAVRALRTIPLVLTTSVHTLEISTQLRCLFRSCFMQTSSSHRAPWFLLRSGTATSSLMTW